MGVWRTESVAAYGCRMQALWAWRFEVNQATMSSK